MKKVKHFMKTDVIYFNPEDSVFDAAKGFSVNNISGAPVVKDGKVVGVISESDIIKFMKLKFPEEKFEVNEPHTISLIVMFMLKDQIEFKKELQRISKIKVKDVMSKIVLHTHPEANLHEVATLMDAHDINRLPVIVEGKLVGIIARADLIKALID